jgi:GNAT superfamily N-acetyltransferase
MARPRPARFGQADLEVIGIRRARPDDAGRLTEIAMEAKASWGYSASFMARCRAALAVDAVMIAERDFYLAEDESGILGFYGFEPEPGGIGVSHMFVLPEAGGRGVGRLLWNHAVRQARKRGASALIAVSDPNAAGFYRRMGAEPAGARPSEIDPARPLPIYRLSLAPSPPRPVKGAGRPTTSR